MTNLDDIVSRYREPLENTPLDIAREWKKSHPDSKWIGSSTVGDFCRRLPIEMRLNTTRNEAMLTTDSSLDCAEGEEVSAALISPGTPIEFSLGALVLFLRAMDYGKFFTGRPERAVFKSCSAAW